VDPFAALSALAANVHHSDKTMIHQINDWIRRNKFWYSRWGKKFKSFLHSKFCKNLEVEKKKKKHVSDT
jgi:hypothetical protein